MRSKDICVSSRQVIAKALSLDANFHDGSIDALWKWIYVYLARNQLSIRRITRQGQKLSGHLRQMQEDVVTDINQRFGSGGTLHDVPKSLFVNMDETAVFFEAHPTSTINAKGENTVSIRCTGSNSRRMTVCVSCASDGTKLPLFFVFKGKSGARIESGLQNELGNNVIACCQEKGWMDQRTSAIWIERVWKPYVRGYTSSFLLLDEFKCHMKGSFIRTINELGTEVDFIPGGYTCVLQPCDVGVNKPLKKLFRDMYMQWSVEKYKNMGPADKLSSPSRKEVTSWMIQAWDTISPETIRKTFQHIGYCVNLPVVDDEDAEEILEDIDLLSF